MTNITFNGNDLQTDNIITANIRHYQFPTYDTAVQALAHANKSKMLYAGFPSKIIVVSGKIFDTTVSALDTRLDTFKGYLTGFDKNLDIDYAGTTRRYIASVRNVNINRPFGLTYADFEIEFIALNPFGMETSTTSAKTATARTSDTYTDNYTFLGSAPWQYPIVTIEFTNLTGGTAKTVSFGNNNNGQTINITRNWAVLDTLVIDSAEQLVTVNDIEVDFTGAFPEFESGVSSAMYYGDNLTTREFNYDVDYYKRYL